MFVLAAVIVALFACEAIVLAWPVSVAVMVPALKLPLPSRATTVLPVLEFVAFDVTVNVAAPELL